MTPQTQEPAVDPHIRRRLLGLFLFPLALFPFLALLTYDWRAIPGLCLPPLAPTPNLIGVLGDRFAYFGYSCVGLAVWVVPALCLGEGLLLLLGRSFHPTRRTLGFALFLFSLTCLLQLLGPAPGIRALLHNLNAAPNAGGAVGYLVMTRGLSRLLSPFGSGVLMGSLLAISIVMMIGVRAILRTLKKVGIWAAGKDKTPEQREAERQARLEEKEAIRAAREEAKQQRLAEKEAARAEREKERAEKQAAKDKAAAEREAEEQEKRDAAARLAAAREAQSASREPQPAESPTPKAKDKTPTYDLREAVRRAREAAMNSRFASAAGVRSAGTPADAAQTADDEPQDAGDEAEKRGPYVIPETSLLNAVPVSAADHGDVDALAQKLVDTLKLFDVDATLAYVVRGPVVTKYALTLAPGTKPEAIRALSSTLQMSLKAKSLRIEAPIPGEDAVGVEVPNKTAATITFREILESPAWTKNVPWPKKGAPKFALPLLLGKDSAGKDLIADLASMPHLLVAGATGQGKSVCLNSIICGLLMSRTPQQLKFIMIDPKSVEFAAYSSLPHLLVPVVTDNKKVVYSLRWAISEMEKRLKLFASVGKRDIASYNARAAVSQPDLFGDGKSDDDDAPATIPYVVIIIDEVADLMSTNGKEVEPLIARIAAKARAAGIHLILATQRPDTKVITGTIKSNIPGRIAFKTSQGIDSRTIIDSVGAEQLIGKGDMLFKTKEGLLVRAQGSWVADDEIIRITDFIAEHADVQFDDRFAKNLAKIKEAAAEDPFADLEEEKKPDDPPPAAANGNPPPAGMTSQEDEEHYRRALEVLRVTGRASTSHLQRKMGIGYNHAARVMDLLEARGIISAAKGGNTSRDILVDLNSPEYLNGAAPMTLPPELAAAPAEENDPDLADFPPPTDDDSDLPL